MVFRGSLCRPLSGKNAGYQGVPKHHTTALAILSQDMHNRSPVVAIDGCDGLANVCLQVGRSLEVTAMALREDFVQQHSDVTRVPGTFWGPWLGRLGLWFEGYL